MKTYEPGINLYKAFKNCLNEGQDKIRLQRLESRLNAWQENLTIPQQQEFTALLCQQGLITGNLVRAIQTFNCRFQKFTEP